MIPIRLVSLEQLKEVYFLARDIYTIDGRILLLKRGAKLDADYRKRLIELGFHSVFISDEYTSDLEPKEIVTPSLRFQANSMVFEFLNKEELLRNRVKIADLRAVARDLVVEILGLDQGILLDFPEIKTFSDYVYLHSVNVAVLGLLIARDLGLSETELEDFAVGALLHDIGKLRLPQDLLSKMGPLTEEEYNQVKEHPRIGFDLLNDKSHVKPRSYAIALQHHETYDGDGYPSGRKGEEIHIFSRIATIVDIFDALTSDRPYKRRWSFLNTLMHLKNSIPEKFDPEVLEAFLKRVPPFPVGSTLKLSTGEVGVVSENHYKYIDRPTVRIIRDTEGNDIPHELVYEIDLQENKDTLIVSNIQHTPV